MYESLWKAANPQGLNDLGGQVVVPFFLKSKVDKGTLKQIWSLSCGQSLNINKEQFFTALRYIVIVQGGDQTVSKEGLVAKMNMQLGLPRFEGVPLTPTASSPVNMVANAPPPYAMTADDHVKYHKLFQQYDSDNDGFITGLEAKGVFSKSGLPQETLKTIWVLADADKDSKLSPKVGTNQKDEKYI